MSAESPGTPLAAAREHMLAFLRRELSDDRVLRAIAAVARERFVPLEFRDQAYDDCALPIGEGQTISQPLIVGMMTEALGVEPEDRVLEVGTGSGYQAAVLAQLAREVITVERRQHLLQGARMVHDELGIENVGVYEAGETLGRAEDAPYDDIIVTAGAPHVPRALLGQLAARGRLVIPIGDLRGQQLVRATKTSHGIELVRLGPCGFVPLIGREAWPSFENGGASRRFKVQ